MRGLTSNTSGAATSAGFNAGFSSKFTDCAASLNATSVSPGTNSTGIGFNIGSNSIIQGCTADGNIGDGIRATFDCFILHNQTSIGQIVNAAGIHVVNNFNRIEGNRVTAIGRGIQVDGTTNLIVRNHVIPQGGVGTVAYMIGPNNSYGPIVPLSTGGAAVNGDTATSTLNDAGGGSHPWANFAAH